MSGTHHGARWAALLLGLAAGCACAAPGDPLAEVQEMVKSGRSAEAMRSLDALISQHPGDAHLRFQKGVMLADQKRTGDAINVFQRLGQDFPALPEPFNNLAVLYVEQGQLDKARSALESAIRSRPNYGTAFQNLGDVYTRMASRAYSRALQMEDPESAPKLVLLRELHDVPASAPVVATVAAASAPSRPVAAAPAASAASATPTVPAAAPSSAPASAAVAAAAASAPPAAAPAASAAAPHAADDNVAVGNAVRDWASAWSRKDVNAYLASYAPGFKGNEASAAAWQNTRRQRIIGKRQISVAVSGLNVEVQKGVAKVSFKQSYVADLLRVTSQKTLELEQHNGKWLIRKESTG